MKKIAVYLILGAIGLLILYVGGSWIFQRGIFKPGPSAASRVQTQTTTAVSKTKGEEAAAVESVSEEAKVTTAKTAQRTEHAVAQIRQVERVIVNKPLPYPDDAFYHWVCQSEFYEGNSDCRGFSSGPEDRNAGVRPRALPGRKVTPATVTD